MSAGTSKKLNKAFVRAYSKNDGAPDSTIPSPHSFREAQRSHEASHTAQAEAPGPAPLAVHDGAAFHTASNVPAPHISFPSTFATASDDNSLSSALLMNQIDTSILIAEPAPATTADSWLHPAPQTPAREYQKPKVTPAPLSEPKTAIHAPQPPLWEAPRYQHDERSQDFRSPVAVPTMAVPTMAVVDQQESIPQVEDHLAASAAWEVDHFGWTDECNHLFDALASAFDEAGEQLRAVTAEGLHVLAVSSTYRGEGRTLVATLLARAAARAGVRVALFDADVDNPQLASQLKVQLETDWLKVLEEGLPLEEAAVATLAETIVAYPLLAGAREKSVRLHDDNIVQLLKQVAEKTDLVIIDLGPYTSDQRRMFPSGSSCPVNAAIVVRDARSTSEEQAKIVAQSLRKMGVEAVGIAENFVRD